MMCPVKPTCFPARDAYSERWDMLGMPSARG